jgi:ribonuclease P protein component
VAVPSSAPAVPRAVTASPPKPPRPVPGSGGLRLGFPGDDRLHTTAEFSAVFSHRRVIRGERFDLHYRPGEAGHPRLGLVIAKKLARRAVLRNLLKRLGREAFRYSRANLPACDLVLRLAKPVAAINRASRRLLRAEIDALLQRLCEKVAT